MYLNAKVQEQARAQRQNTQGGLYSTLGQAMSQVDKMTYNAKVYAAAEYAATVDEQNKTQSIQSRDSRRLTSKQGMPKKKVSKKLSKQLTSHLSNRDDKDHTLEEPLEKG